MRHSRGEIRLGVTVVGVVVVSLMFFVAKVGDDIDVEFVGGEYSVGVNISCAKNVITEMSGYRLHFHATLIGAFGVRCFE